MDIESALKKYIVTEIMHELDPSVLDNETALIEEGVIDSMSLIELVHFIEKHFLVTISEDELDIDNFKTVNALSDFIKKKMKMS